MNKEELIAIELKKREEIINTFDKNYLLEAGAGAGKTTIIVQRILNHIITSDINPVNLVAITFTKAAATELAERIQLKALDYLKYETNPEIIERLKAVDRIFTGTIHSFCELILREMPFDANITPNYEIIEDDFEFHNNIWNSFLRDKQKEYKELIDLLKELDIDYRELRTKAILALENPDIKFVGYGDIDYSFKSLKKDFQDLIEKYKDLDSGLINKSLNLSKLFGAILEEKGEFSSYMGTILKECPKVGPDVEEVYGKIIYKKHLDCTNQDEYKKLIVGVYSIYFKLNKLIYNTCTDFINMVVEYKKENYQGKLTFNELLYRASTLIKESKDARAHFKNKYKYFYVDEFQDTDPMQAELILHLTDMEDDYTGVKYWQDSKPIPGSLFVVGDPKQSIYRFRRADITIYNRVKDIIEKNGEVVYLDINFRSSDDICNWVESTFKNNEDGFGFKEEATDIQAGFKKILSLWDDSVEDDDKEYEKVQLKGIYKYNYPEKDDEEYVANIVEDILENCYITEKKRRNIDEIIDGERDYYNITRKVNLGDIMILTKANAETGLYLRALKNRGISALLAGEKQLGDTREVLNLYILIDALIDYRDNIKVVSALRNSFYIDLDTIDFFMEDENNLSQYIFFKSEIEKIKHSSIKKAFRHINEIAELSRILSPIAFIEIIIENKYGVYNTQREYEKLELRDAESALRQTVEILKSKNCGSLYEIREELNKLVYTAVNYELPINKDESENAIRIMNIHKAKGLEANIVILVGGQKERNMFPETHFVDKDENHNSIGYMVYKSNLGTKGPDETERKEIEKTFKNAEIDRLLYVAATRAKSVLIVADGEGKNLFLNPLARNIEKEIISQREIQDKSKNTEFTKEKEIELYITKDLRIIKEISNPSYFRITPSGFEAFREGNVEDFYEGQTIFKSPNFKKSEIIELDSTSTINAYKGPRGNIFGTMVHRALEILVNKSNRLNNIEENIIDYAIRLSIDESIDNLELNKTNIRLLYSFNKNKVKEILDMRMKEGNEKVRRIIKDSLYKYLRKVLINFISNEGIIELFNDAEKIFTELPFTIAIDRNNKKVLDKLSSLISQDKIRMVKKDDKTMLVNGVMDLVIKSKENNWTILDYKTDVSFREDIDSKLRKAYTSQLEGYKILFEEIMKDEDITVDNLLFYSTFEDKIVDVYVVSGIPC